MSGAKQIGLLVGMIGVMAVSAGCTQHSGLSGKELSESAGVSAGGLLTQESAGKADKKEKTTEVLSESRDGEEPEALVRGGGIRGQEAPLESEGTADQDISEYPKTAALPRDKGMRLAMFSEGCYCIFDGALYGFMTEDGEEITPFLYDRAAPFSEGLACVSLGGKYGFIGKDGETVLPFVYDQASSFTEGLAYFRIGEEYGFLDHEGRVVLQPDCDSVSTFQEGRAYYSIDGLYGYLDRRGNVMAEPVYDDAGSFCGGLAIVMRDGGYGVLGMDGKEILQPEYGSVEVEDAFILAEKNGLWYCFDGEGRQVLEEGQERIYVREGLLLIKRRDQFGLADGDGRVLLEPEYGMLYPIPEKKLVIAELDGVWGVLDYEGKETVPFLYSWISYDDRGDGLQVTCTERSEEDAWDYRHYKGFLGFTEADGFTEIVPAYDSMSFFVGDRAVVSVDKKYGLIRRDGTLELPIEYDLIRLFEDGSMALWTNDMARLFDSSGKMICSGEFDSITAYGRGYEVTKDGKHGFLNGQGEQLLPVIYDYCSDYDICGADNVRSMTRYGQGVREVLVKTDEEEGTDLREVFLQNYITPRAGEYLDFLENGSVSVEEGGFIAELSEFSQACRSFSKLYRIGEEVVLYFHAEPYEEMNFPLSNSGFFALRGGKITELAAGYECGGSMRGDSVCFWYDKEKSRRLPGVRGSWGGFGGYAYGGYVYELEDGKADLSVSWYSVSQTVGNYDVDELLENAELFYDSEGRPCTRESVLEAGSVTEYEVDEVRITKEYFEEIRGRYCYMDPLDLYFY